MVNKKMLLCLVHRQFVSVNVTAANSNAATAMALGRICDEPRLCAPACCWLGDSSDYLHC
jgi:hypothetical protein